MEEYKMKCKECKAERWCIHTFGKYYLAKSHNGEGCNCPLPQDDATIKRHLAAIPPPDPF